MISISANQQKAVISHNVKICCLLSKIAIYVPKIILCSFAISLSQSLKVSILCLHFPYKTRFFVAHSPIDCSYCWLHPFKPVTMWSWKSGNGKMERRLIATIGWVRCLSQNLFCILSYTCSTFQKYSLFRMWISAIWLQIVLWTCERYAYNIHVYTFKWRDRTGIYAYIGWSVLESMLMHHVQISECCI